jgi:hypothetical protein
LAQSRFRHFPIFVASKKVALCNDVTLDTQSGDVVQYDATGIAGLSDGIEEYKLSFGTVTPVSGDPSFDIWDLITNKKEFTAKIFIGGKFISFPARVVSAQHTSQSKTGEAHGKFEVVQAGPASIS